MFIDYGIEQVLSSFRSGMLSVNYMSLLKELVLSLGNYKHLAP